MPLSLLGAIEMKARGRRILKPKSAGTPGKSTSIRRVRTVAGEQRYKQRIGSIILADTKLTGMFTHGSTYPGWDRIERVNIDKNGMINPKKPLTGELYDLGYDNEKGKWVAYHADTYDEAFSADTEDDLFRGLNAQWSGTHQETASRGFGSTSSGYSRPDMQTRASLSDEFGGWYNTLQDNFPDDPNVSRLMDIFNSYDTTHEGMGVGRGGGFANPRTGEGLTEAEMVVALQDFIGSTPDVSDEEGSYTTHGLAQQLIGSVYSHSPRLPKNEVRLRAIAKETRDAKDAELTTPTPIKLNDVSEGMWIRMVLPGGASPTEWYRVRRVGVHSSARRSFDVDQGKGTPIDRRVLSQITNRDKLETIGKPPSKDTTSTTPAEPEKVVPAQPDVTPEAPPVEDRLTRQRREAVRSGAAAGAAAAARFNEQQRAAAEPPAHDFTDFRDIEDEDEAADMAREVAAELGLEESPGQWDDWELWTAPDGERYDFGFDEESGKWYSTYEGDWDRVVSEGDNWWDTFHGLLAHVAGERGVPGDSTRTTPKPSAAKQPPQLTRFEQRNPIVRSEPTKRTEYDIVGLPGGEGLPVSERLAAGRKYGSSTMPTQRLNALDSALRSGDGTAAQAAWAQVDKDLEQAGVGPDEFPRAGLRKFMAEHVSERGEPTPEPVLPTVTVDNLDEAAEEFDERIRDIENAIQDERTKNPGKQTARLATLKSKLRETQDEQEAATTAPAATTPEVSPRLKKADDKIAALQRRLDLAAENRKRKRQQKLRSPQEVRLAQQISDARKERDRIRREEQGTTPNPAPAAAPVVTPEPAAKYPTFSVGDELEVAVQTAGGTYPTWRVIEVRPYGQILAETTTPDGGTSRRLLYAGRYKKKGTLPKAEAGEGTGASSVNNMDALGAPSVYPMGAATITAPTKVRDLNEGDVIVFGQFMGSKQPKYRRISKVKHTSRNTYVWFEGDSEDLSPMTQAPDQEVSLVVAGPDDLQMLDTPPIEGDTPTFTPSTLRESPNAPALAPTPSPSPVGADPRRFISSGLRASTSPYEYAQARSRVQAVGTDIAARALRAYNSNTLSQAEFDELIKREEDFAAGRKLPYSYTGRRPTPSIPPYAKERPPVVLNDAIKALAVPAPNETAEQREEREATYRLAVHLAEAQHLYQLDREDARQAADYAASLEMSVLGTKPADLPKAVRKMASLRSERTQTRAYWGIAQALNAVADTGEKNPDAYVAAIRNAARENHGLEPGQNIGSNVFYNRLHHTTGEDVSGLDTVRVDTPSYTWSYVPPEEHRDVNPRLLGLSNEPILRSSVTVLPRAESPVLMVDDDDYTRHGLPRDQEMERGAGTRTKRPKGGKGKNLTTYEYAAMQSVAQGGDIGALEQVLGSSVRRENLLRRGFIEETTPGRFRLTDAGLKVLDKRNKEEAKKRRRPGVFALDGEVVPGTDNPAQYITDRAKEMFPNDTDQQLYLQRVASRVKSGEWTLSQARETILARAQRQGNTGLSDLSEELALILALLRTGRGAKSDRIDGLITKALAASNTRMSVEEAKAFGAMVALMPSGDDADALAIEGGEAATELHVTMLYLGKADRYDPYTRSQIISSVRNSCIGVNAINANAFSASIFNPKGKEPCVVLGVGGKGLDQIRNVVKTNLMEDTLVGPPPEAHEPWVPHITLAYTDDPKSLMGDVEERTGDVKFDRVGVFFGGDVTYIKLGTYQQPGLEHRLDLLMQGKDVYSAHNYGDRRHTVETRGKIRNRQMRRAASDSDIASLGAADSDEGVGGVKPARERIGSAKPVRPTARDRAVRAATIHRRNVEKEMTDAVELKAPVITPGGRVGDDASHDYSPRENWVDKRGGLPKYIRVVRNALVRQGHSESRATAIAIATMKKWASGRGNVSAKVRAAAAKAVAQWEAMKATKDAALVLSGK